MGSSTLWNQWRSVSAADDPRLASSFWTENQARLTAIAQSWLDRMLDKSASGDATSHVTAFEVFCLSSGNEGGVALRGADELWRLTAAIVMSQRQALDMSKQMSERSADDPTTNVASSSAGTSAVVPSDLAQLMTDELQRLLGLLADVDLEVVVIAKLCDATDDALGREMNYTRRTIQRMLKLIRSIWSDELAAIRRAE